MLPNGDHLSQIDAGHHSYVLLDRFVKPDIKSPSLACLIAAPSAGASEILDNWATLRRVVDRVHCHTCGHVTYSDMRTLLMINCLWNDHVQQYLASTVAECRDCKASSAPPPNRGVLLSPLDRFFNDLVCIDRFHLENVTLLHVMDVSTRFSAAHAVTSTSIEGAIYAFEMMWFSHFWPPGAVNADSAFQKEPFDNFLSSYDVQLRPVPPRRHQKNMIESRYGVVRSIFLRLRHADSNAPATVLAIRAVWISNDLYRNDVFSSFEPAKGSTRPVDSPSTIRSIPENIIESQDKITAKRKLNRILRSNTLQTHSFKPGDIVQVYLNDDNAKRGAWSSPRVILSIDHDSGSIVVPGRGRKRVIAAVEDARAVPDEDPLVTVVQLVIDELGSYIDDVLKVISPNDDKNDGSYSPPTSNRESDCDFSPAQPTRPNTGDRVEVFWPDDNQYYSDSESDVQDDGKCLITYDDDDTETLNMDHETWRFEQSSLQASSLQIQKVLKSNEQEVIRSMTDSLGQRPFMWHHAQGFE